MKNTILLTLAFLAGILTTNNAARRGDSKRQGFNFLPVLCIVLFSAVMTACGGGIAAVKSPTDDRTVQNATDESAEVAKKPVKPRPQGKVIGKYTEWNYGTWTLTKTDDDFDGVSYSASSEEVKPDVPLDFPYGNARAYIYVYCQKAELLGVKFSGVNMFVGIDKGHLDAHPTIYDELAEVRYKFDDGEVKTDSGFKGWVQADSRESISPGTSRIEFMDALTRHNSLVLELIMHDSARRRFSFDLNGADMAIAELRGECEGK